MYHGSAVVRRTPLAEKVYAKAAEIEKIRQEAIKQRREAEREAIRFEAENARFRWPQDRISSYGQRLRIRDALAASAQYFNLEPRWLVDPIRTKEITFARQVAMYVAQRYCRGSYPQIGQVFDRDHTTVLSGVRKIDRLIKAGDQDVISAVSGVRWQMDRVRVKDFIYWGC